MAPLALWPLRQRLEGPGQRARHSGRGRDQVEAGRKRHRRRALPYRQADLATLRHDPLPRAADLLAGEPRGHRRAAEAIARIFLEHEIIAVLAAGPRAPDEEFYPRMRRVHRHRVGGADIFVPLGVEVAQPEATALFEHARAEVGEWVRLEEF